MICHKHFYISSLGHTEKAATYCKPQHFQYTPLQNRTVKQSLKISNQWIVRHIQTGLTMADYSVTDVYLVQSDVQLSD